MIVASGGITGWQAWPGTEKRWKSDSPDGSSGDELAAAGRVVPARTSAIALVPPTAGTLWHTAQLVPLKAGPSPSSDGLDLEEVVEAEPELLELHRRDAGQRVAGHGHADLSDEHARRRARQGRPVAVTRTEADTGIVQSNAVTRRDDHAAHELVSGAAHARALERVAAGLWLEVTVATPRPRFGQLDIDVGADDVEAVRGVVALQPNLETRAGFHANLRGRERESLGGDLDDARVLCASRRLEPTTAPADRRSRARSSLIECAHQNHHPSPTLNEFGALITEL